MGLRRMPRTAEIGKRDGRDPTSRRTTSRRTTSRRATRRIAIRRVTRRTRAGCWRRGGGGGGGGGGAGPPSSAVLAEQSLDLLERRGQYAAGGALQKYVRRK